MNRKISLLTLLMLLTLVMGLTQSVFAAEATYIGSDGEEHTVQNAQPFPTDKTAEVILGQEGQETWYTVDELEYGADDTGTIYTVQGTVNIISVDADPSVVADYTAYIFGRFQVPGNAVLNFYARNLSSNTLGTLAIESVANPITGFEEEMGEVNFKSGTVTPIGNIVDDNPIVGPSSSQTGGSININGGILVLTSIIKPSPGKVALGTSNPENKTCQINVTGNSELYLPYVEECVLAASTEPGPNNNYNVSINGNCYVSCYGFGTIGNTFSVNPDGSAVSGLIELIEDPESFNSNAVVYGNVRYPYLGFFTLSGNSTLTIPENSSLTFTADSWLKIEDDSQLILNGELNNYGSVALLGRASVSGKGTFQNGLESFVQNTNPWEGFSGSFENEGNLYLINEEYSSFQYPDNYTGELGSYLEFIQETLPSGGTTCYGYQPIGNPASGDIQLETVNTVFNGIGEGEVSGQVKASLLQDQSEVYIHVQTGNYVYASSFELNDYEIRAYEDYNGSPKLNMLIDVSIDEAKVGETVYMTPNSETSVDATGYDNFEYNGGPERAEGVESDELWMESDSQVQNQIIALVNSATGERKYIQVKPLPVDLRISLDGEESSDELSLKPDTSYSVNLDLDDSSESGWSLNEVTYFGSGGDFGVFLDEVVNLFSNVGTGGASIGAITQGSGTGAVVTTNGNLGLGFLEVELNLTAPTGEPINTIYKVIAINRDANNIMNISLGTVPQSEAPTLEFSPKVYENGIWYGELYGVFTDKLGGEEFSAQTPICGQENGATGFLPYVQATQTTSFSQVIGEGQYIFVSSNPDVICYNPETYCFEFGSKEGTAQIHIQSPDGSLSTLNAPEGQLRYYNVQVGDTVLPETVTLDQERVYLTTLPGGVASATVGYSLSPENAAGNPEWSIEPTTVAEVTPNPDGSATVNAVAEGAATLTCRIGDAEGSAAVTVSDRGVTCDSVELAANGSPDTFNVIAKNLQPNPALGGGKPVVRGEMFAFSAGEPSDLNAKRLVNVPGTNDWMVGSIPVNGSRVNNWFYYADYINVHVYASTDILSDGELVWAGWHSWTDGSPLGGTVQYTGIVFDEGFGIPTVSSGIAGAMGKPIIGLRVSSLVPGVDVETSFYTQDTGWFGSESDNSMWYEDGASVVPYTTLGGYMGLGNSTVIQAYRFRLTGEEAGNYDLQFRAYVQDAGWQDWVSVAQNPEAVMGFPGEDLSIEAFCMRLVPAGTPLPDATVFK